MRRLTKQQKHEAARTAKTEHGRRCGFHWNVDSFEPGGEDAEEHIIGPELEAELRASQERRTAEKERQREARVLVEGDIVTIDGVTRQLKATRMHGWARFVHHFEGYEIESDQFARLVDDGKAKRITCHDPDCVACGNAKHRRNVFELLMELDRWLQG